MRLKSLFKVPERVPPYTKLAPIYDYLMRHVDYQRWADYVSLIFKMVQVDVRTILDIACGTGTLIQRLRQRGYKAVGFDLSQEMISLAKRKNQGVPLWRGDMRCFASKRRFDAVVCLFDSINYLMNLKELGEVLRAVEEVLHKEGIFIFDISTEKNSLKNFNNYCEKDKKEGFCYIRRGYYDSRGGIQYNDFTIGFQEDGWRRYREVHRQRVYSLREVEEEVHRSGLGLRYVFEGFTFREATEDSYRAHFILQKNY